MPDFTPELLLFGFLWYVAFLFSTTCHEAAHALVAKIGGDETAALGGQVTLNPIPHIRREPFGMVLLPILSYVFTRSMFGWASAPYDPNWQRRHPHRAAWMALAGPVANFTLMFIAGIFLRLGFSYGLFQGGSLDVGGIALLRTVLGVFFSLNLLLGTFNLLPFPPLDGSSVVMLFMPQDRAIRYIDWLAESSFRMIGLVIAILLFGRVYPYIQDFARQILFYGI